MARSAAAASKLDVESGVGVAMWVCLRGYPWVFAYVGNSKSGRPLHARIGRPPDGRRAPVINPLCVTRPGACYLLAVGVADPGVLVAEGVAVLDEPPGVQVTSGLRLPNIASMSAAGWREAMVMLVLATAPTQIVVFLSCALWMH